ncbi:MAG: twin-arginine translocation signal domain-containing protein [Mesorhizobium sp.]|nr:MAG: twin-arginine translocation signal domain-containing protein [Mesorhizobium sp.]
MLVNRACRRFHFRHDNLIKGNDDMFKNPVSRRKFLKNAASATAIGTLGSLVANTAYAADTITATEWGGSYIDQMKKIAAKQSDIQVNWHMYSGGAALILPKIKATWPNPGIDLVAGTFRCKQSPGKAGQSRSRRRRYQIWPISRKSC